MPNKNSSVKIWPRTVRKLHRIKDHDNRPSIENALNALCDDCLRSRSVPGAVYRPGQPLDDDREIKMPFDRATIDKVHKLRQRFRSYRKCDVMDIVADIGLYKRGLAFETIMPARNP